MVKTLLWLDDFRNPYSKTMNWLKYSPIGYDVELFWIENYQEFVDFIMIYGLPDAICFDHDLGSESLTGYDCAKWLVNYCLDNNKPLPKYGIQSDNTVGKANIDGLFKSFIRFVK
jgi:hypothetical protein